MTLLCIDNDEDDLAIFSEAITYLSPSCRCKMAYGGTEGLEILKTVQPDYIFLDINMPRMNGKEVLSKIRSMPHLKEVPVIMLSTSISDGDHVELITKGATHCMKKLPDFTAFCNALQQVLQLPDNR